MNINRLVELRAISEQAIRFDTNEDDDGSLKKIGLAGAATGAGLYGAGALGNLKVGGANGVPSVITKGLAPGAALEKLGQNVSTLGQGGLSDIASTVGRGAKVAKQGAMTAWDVIKGKLAKGAAAGVTALSSRHSKLIQLRAKTSVLINFNSNLLWDLPDDWKRHGETYVRNTSPGSMKADVTNKKYERPIRTPQGKHPRPLFVDTKADPDGEGVTIYDDRSDSRIRRTKAVALAGGTYLAGRKHAAIKGFVKGAARDVGQVARNIKAVVGRP